MTDENTAVENTEIETVDEVEQEPAEETFDRKYVEELRAESAKYRTRAKSADDLARRLHTELVRAAGVLADPTDLEFDEKHLADEGALRAALDDLVARKPHLRARTIAGDVGQGQSGAPAVSLVDLMRGRA